MKEVLHEAFEIALGATKAEILDRNRLPDRMASRAQKHQDIVKEAQK
jgi:hypothetical protein